MKFALGKLGAGQHPVSGSRTRNAFGQWALLLPTVLIVLLTTLYYEHLLTAPADSFYARVVVRTTTPRSATSSNCAQAEAQPCYHHPLLPVRCTDNTQTAAQTGSKGLPARGPNVKGGHPQQATVPQQQQQQQQQTGLPEQQLAQQPMDHLTVPRYAAVASSRSALQAYLSSAQFAAAAAALSPDSARAASESTATSSNTPDAGVGSTAHSSNGGSSSSSNSWQRGILVVAGGRKLLTHLVVQLKVLRETLRCTLPVEVAWQGPQEMDNATLTALQDRFGPLRGFDVQAMPYPPYMNKVPLTRWVGKVAALLHCSFKEVQLLDSDNIPLRDPAYLFSDPLYQQHGNLFWPDFWSNWVKPGVYPWLGFNRTAVLPLLLAGAGFTGRDAESGMLLIDRARWLDVLYWTFWINTWHNQLYYRVIHGDKDTFALGFALAGHADKYRQVSVVPGGVFRWGKDQLEVKAQGPNTTARTADGWQLLGALQHDDAGRLAFFHRTMNKLSPDEEPWSAEVLTGPLHTKWLAYYLAHDSKGPTKGVWWEHVAPDSAFAFVPDNSSSSSSSSLVAGTAGSKIGNDNTHVATAGGCPRKLFSLYEAALQAGMPVEINQHLECACRLEKALQHHTASNSRPAQQSKGQLSASPAVTPSTADTAGSAPIAAARVSSALLQLSPALQVIQASDAALAWLKSAEGRAAFPSLAPGSTMP